MRQVQRIVPSIYHKRLFAYFERYGCIRCGGKKVLYCSNRLCRACTDLLIARLQRCDRAMEREYSKAVAPPSDRLITRITTARALLADLKKEKNLKAARRNWNKPPAKWIEYRPAVQIRETQPGAMDKTAKLLI
jgi:hypothetical protein